WEANVQGRRAIASCVPGHSHRETRGRRARGFSVLRLARGAGTILAALRVNRVPARAPPLGDAQTSGNRRDRSQAASLFDSAVWTSRWWMNLGTSRVAVSNPSVSPSAQVPRYHPLLVRKPLRRQRLSNAPDTR